MDQKLAFCLGYMMARQFTFLPKAVKEALAPKQEEREWPVALDTETNDPAYLAGRLFYICESLQEAALPNVLSSIDRQYLAAAVNRAEVTMPVVLDKAQAHIKKLTKKSSDKKALGYWYLGLINQLADRLPHDEGGTLALPQGMTGTQKGKMTFLLGYFNEEYSWRKTRLEKKEKDEDAEEDPGASDDDSFVGEDGNDEAL